MEFYKGYKIKAKEIWKKDEIKINFLKEFGYTVLIIWECDYLNNKDMAIQKCLGEINV